MEDEWVEVVVEQFGQAEEVVLLDVVWELELEEEEAFGELEEESEVWLVDVEEAWFVLCCPDSQHFSPVPP